MIPEDGGTGTGLLDGAGKVTVADDHFTKADGFPEELAGKVVKFADPAALSKGYSELATKLGTAIIPPTEDATDEQKTAYTEKLHKLSGRPDTADGYEIKKPETLPAGLSWDDAMVAKVKQFAFQQGWSPAAVNGLVEMHTAWQTELLGRGDAAMNEAAEQASAQLKTDLGESKYNVAVQTAEKAFQELLVAKHPKLAELLKGFGLHNNAHFIRYMIDMYELKLGEGTIVTGDGDAGGAKGGKYLNYNKVDK